LVRKEDKVRVEMHGIMRNKQVKVNEQAATEIKARSDQVVK
jgi:hypothetical protein